MIWISKDIFSKTSNDFYFWPFFFYSKTYSCVWLLPFITKIFADGKSRGQKIGHFCGGHKWMTLNFKNLTVFCNIMVICGSWKSWRVVFTSGYTKKKQWFVIHNPESFNSTPGFICGFTAKIFYQERYLQSQFWFRYERSTVRSS